MRKISLLAVVVVAGAVLVYSCSKNSSSQKTKTQLLTQSTWKYDTAGIDANSDGLIDEALPAGYVMDCQKDNLLIFNSDSTGTADEGPTKCNSSDPQTTSFTWSFNASQSSITSSSAIFSGIGGDFTITSLTETQLHLGKTVTTSGITVNLAIYLKH